MKRKKRDELLQRLERSQRELKRRLSETQDTLRAVIAGQVDGVFDDTPTDSGLYLLETADRFYRTIVEEMSQGTAIVDDALTLVHANPRLAEIVGARRKAFLGDPLASIVAPRSAAALDALLKSARDGHAEADIDFEYEGTPVSTLVGATYLAPHKSYCLVITDLSERKRMQSLAASQQLLARILEQAADAIIVCDDAGRVVDANRPARELVDGDLILRRFDDVFPMHVVDNGRAPLDRVLAGETLRCEAEFPCGAETRHVLFHGSPLDDGAAVTGCVVNLTDITDLKDAQRRQEIVVSELDHRMRNALAGVRAIATQTLRQSDELDDFRARFGRRLGAFARAHRLLLEKGWESASLADVVRSEVRPFADPREVLDLDGAAVSLRPNAAWTFQVVCHELTTNAAKYGALKEPGGRIEVRWAVEAGGDLDVSWRERCRARVATNSMRRGSGLSLMENVVSYELDGSIAFEVGDGGLAARMRVPWDARVGWVDGAGRA